MENKNTLKVLSIDAWRGFEGGWDWNNWYAVGDAPTNALNYSKRKLLNWMRSEGYLSAQSAGKVSVEDDGYNLTIVERGNRRPLFAIEYGNKI
jgi:hypothetical protein